MKTFSPASFPRALAVLLAIGAASLIEHRPATALADDDPKPASATADPGDQKLQQLEADRDLQQKKLARLNVDIEKQLSEFDRLDTDTADLKNQESSLEDLRDHPARRQSTPFVEH